MENELCKSAICNVQGVKVVLYMVYSVYYAGCALHTAHCTLHSVQCVFNINF